MPRPAAGSASSSGRLSSRIRNTAGTAAPVPHPRAAETRSGTPVADAAPMLHPLPLLAGLCLLLAPSLSAQRASYSLFGTDCTTGRLAAGIGPVPIAVRGLPRLGTTFQVVTECTTTYPFGTRRQVFVLTGFSNTSASGVPLPFDVSTLAPGQPFCGMLYTNAEVMTPVPPQRPYTTPSAVDFPVPSSTLLAGLTFYQQVLTIERSTFGPPFFALQLSRGGQGTIGF